MSLIYSHKIMFFFACNNSKTKGNLQVQSVRYIGMLATYYTVFSR